MGKTAVLFPGQGAQAVGMGREAYEKSAAARAVFDLADRVLPVRLTEVIFNGPEGRLTETSIAQPAILATSIALVEAAKELGWKADAAATAGLSLGEYSALVFAGAISLEDALVLVHKRGTYMHEAGVKNPGGMLSIIGLDEAAVGGIVADAARSGRLVAANLNCPGQVVLSGEAPALEAAEKLANERGAMKAVMLKVDGAFHSPLMREAAERLLADLEKVRINAPRVPFVANVTADFASDPAEIRALLARQVTSPVLWEKCARRLMAAGMEGFVEIGPGRVLSGLMRRTERKAAMEAVGDMDAAAKLASFSRL